MGWNHPEISLDEMMKLIKGFVDILILASGYQSSGIPAHWDAHNIKKAFQWALFFENVIRHLSSTDVYLDSFKELDATVNEITSNPSFPQGLSHLSCSTLSRARAFVSEYFIHALPLRDAHLSAFLRATVEMDLDELSKMVDDCFNMYLKKLMLLDSSLDLVLEPRGFVKDSYKSSSDVSPLKKIDKCTADDFTSFAVQGLSKRQSALSCISTVKAGLDVLSTAVKHSSCTKPYNSFSEENLNQVRALALMGGEDDLVDFVTWNCWKSRNFLYFLDMRTVRLASGASMIFSAPKSQWVQVFEQLHISAEGSDDDFSEIIELLLLGCTGSKWSCLIEYFMSVSYDSLPISKQYHELCKGIRHLHSKEEMMNLKDTCILEYLIKLLSGQLHHLWKLPPVLVSVAIPLWSPLFGLYLSEIETHYKGDTLTMRFCTCLKDGKEHKDWLKIALGFNFGPHKNIEHVFSALILLLIMWILVEGDPVLEVGKKMGSTGSAVTLVSLERKDPSSGGCSTSYVVMQLFWKLKSLWKQALGWQRMNVQYSYDIHSYSLNFDDGSFLDHRLHNSC